MYTYSILSMTRRRFLNRTTCIRPTIQRTVIPFAIAIHQEAMPLAECDKMASSPKVPKSTAEAEFLAQHDARLDVLVVKISSALQTPGQDAESLAKHAITCASSTSSGAREPRELLSRALRKSTLNVLKGGMARGDANIRTKAFDASLALIDATIILVRDKLVDAVLPLALLEYVFTFHTQTELAERISAIRQRYEAFDEARPEKLGDVYIIKSVMSCINRDQPGSNPVLSGRLRLMLAASLPVWHPSGMNRRAQFNTVSPPDYESFLTKVETPGVDVALYKAFWRLQTLMANPSLAESAPQWREAHEAMLRVLVAFETIPISDENDSVSSPYQPSTTPPPLPPMKKSSTMDCAIPKYLTAPTILRLQLADINVRRHVLMQYAVFLHHLEVVSSSKPSIKESPTGKETPVSKAAKASHEFCKTLFELRGEGEKLRDRVYSVLETDSSGRYKRFLLSLLQRERKWIVWKKQQSGYAHLKRKAITVPETFKRRKIVSAEAKSRSSRVHGLPEWQERQRAWKAPPPSEHKEALVERGKAEFWSMDVLKMELQEDKEDEDVTEDMKRKNDSKYLWRTLRMLCDENVSCLMKLADSSNSNLDLEEILQQDVDAPNQTPKT